MPTYDVHVSPLPTPPPDAVDWVALSAEPLPLEAVHPWLVRSRCGAVVQFTGTTRDHSGSRRSVSSLSYEAYDTEALGRMEALAAELRRRWPDVEALAMLHRTGEVGLREPAVVVGVSAAHRDVAFEAARFGIDALKLTVPIWKRERHAGGQDWGLEGNQLAEVDELQPAWPAGASAAGGR